MLPGTVFQKNSRRSIVLLAGLLVLIQINSCREIEPLDPVATSDPGEENPDQPLAVPVDLHVLDVGDTYLQLAWADTSGQAAAIVVEGRRAGVDSFSTWSTLPAGTAEWETEVQPDSTYEFRIAACDGDDRSAWTEPVRATALPLGYWEVTGGVNHQAPDCRSLFFRFGRANRFRPDGGTLTITGPDDWNDGNPYQRPWDTYYIGLTSRGTATGEYTLTYQTPNRFFTATVFIDATLVLPLPEVDVQVLPGRRVRATWSCEGAQSYAFCWGPAGEAGCHSAGTTTDTLLTALENDPVYWLDISAYCNDYGGQPARSSRFFEIELPEE